MKSKFLTTVAGNAHIQKTQGTSYGHLNLPSGVPIFKEVPGSKITLDFLPYIVTDPKHLDKNEAIECATVGELWYKKPYRLHRNVGANFDTVVCPSTIGKKCPICEYRAIKQKEQDVDKDEIQALNFSKRNLYLVIPIGVKDFDEVPHIWDISQFLFQAALNEELEENPENAIFPDPENGLSLRIRFSSETFAKNAYAKTARIDFIERDQAYSNGFIKKLPCLDDVLSILPYKVIENKFLGIESDEDEDVAEDRNSKQKNKTRSYVKNYNNGNDTDDDEEDIAISPKKKKTDDDIRANRNPRTHQNVSPTRTKRKQEDIDDDDEDDTEVSFKRRGSRKTNKATSLRDEGDDFEEE